MSEEERLTDHIVAWAEERGLEIAKYEVPPYKSPFDERNYVNPKVLQAFYPGVGLVDEMNYSHYFKETRWMRVKEKISYKKWRLEYQVSLFLFKVKNRWQLPEHMCCWTPNLCLTSNCGGYEHDDVHDIDGCASCGKYDPCPDSDPT